MEEWDYTSYMVFFSELSEEFPIYETKLDYNILYLLYVKYLDMHPNFSDTARGSEEVIRSKLEFVYEKIFDAKRREREIPCI